METRTYNVRLSDGQTFGPADMSLLMQWAREGRIPRDAWLFPAAGGAATGVLEFPELAPLVLAPPTVSGGLHNPYVDTPGPALIPYKNPPALIGYYFSIFALIPFIGFAPGVPAVILGIVGLVKRSRDPNVRGAAHAWIAIILGVLGPIATSALTVFLMNHADQL